MIRLAALELSATPSSEIVKVAGILSKLKRWWSDLLNPSQQEEFEHFRSTTTDFENQLKDLQDLMSQFDRSVKDANYSEYERVLTDIRGAVISLAKQIKDFQETAIQTATVVKNISEAKEVAESETTTEGAKEDLIADRKSVVTYDYDHYKKNKQELLDESKRQIEKYHQDHDVSFGEGGKKLTSYKWFSGLTPDNIAVNWGEGSAGFNVLNKIHQFSKNDDVLLYKDQRIEFIERLKKSILEGTLLNYDVATPVKDQIRQINQNLMVVETAPLKLEIGLTVHLILVLSDLKAGRNGHPYISLRYTRHVKILEDLNKKSSRLELFQKLAGVDHSASKRLPESFWVKFVEMSNRLGAKPEDLAKVIRAESDFDSSATNVQNGRIIAKGLNQLLKSTAKNLEMTDQQWESYERATPEAQLPYVEKYFRNVGKATIGDSPWESATQIYIANFAPKYTKKSSNPNAVLYSNKTESGSDNPAYHQNKGLDRTGKGHITAGDLAKSVQGPLPLHIDAAIQSAKAKLSGKPVMQDVSKDLPATNPANEVDELLNLLVASNLADLVKLAKIQEYLPKNTISIVTDSSSAKTAQAALTATFNTDVESSTIGNWTRLAISLHGSKTATLEAVQAICDTCSNAIALRTLFTPTFNINLG